MTQGEVCRRMMPKRLPGTAGPPRNGDRLGMNNLGWMYQSGRAVAQDDAQAVVWYRKAAGKGEPLGMNNLGWMYENGRGVVKI